MVKTYLYLLSFLFMIIGCKVEYPDEIIAVFNRIDKNSSQNY